jgi:hypothetical protein
MARKHEELISGCMAKAFTDEPTFVLLARDPCAPSTIRAWIEARVISGNNQEDDPKIAEAQACAETMEQEQSIWANVAMEAKLAIAKESDGDA